MTKEEILWLKPQPTQNSVTINGAKEAMEEYAKQQTITFFKWVHEDIREFVFSETMNRWYPSADGYELEYYTVEGLYNLYIDQHQKQNQNS